jgi:hypothetical protein
MTKVGRNEQCHCGSGKKYKKCHGAPAKTASVQRNNTQTHVHEVAGVGGLSGMETMMHIMVTENPDAPKTPTGLPGKYKVTLVLNRPGYSAFKENEINFTDSIEGDSHMFIGANELVFEATLPNGILTLHGYPNERGFLSKVVIEEVDAASFFDANLTAHYALSATLSRCSLVADVPLSIYFVTTTELSTQSQWGTLRVPFLNKRIPYFTDYGPDKALAKFASLYREALNSNSPNYQYLSYFRIIEGVRRIRGDRATREKETAFLRGEKPHSMKRERLPTTREEQVAWLNSVFFPQNWSDLALVQIFPQEALGKKLNAIITQSGVLDRIRNRIAHAVMRDEARDTITIDDGRLVNEVATWLPLCKSVARYLLKSEYPKLFDVR